MPVTILSEVPDGTPSEYESVSEKLGAGGLRLFPTEAHWALASTKRSITTGMAPAWLGHP